VTAGSVYSSNLAPSMDTQNPQLSADIVNIVGIDEMAGILRVDIQVCLQMSTVIFIGRSSEVGTVYCNVRIVERHHNLSSCEDTKKIALTAQPQ
jgi:hypothetical protein